MARGEDRGTRIGTGALTSSLAHWLMVSRVLRVECRMSNGSHPQGVIKTVGHAPGLYGVRRQAKRDAALAERLVLRWIRHERKPKRRRASLAAALHMAVADTFNPTPTHLPLR